MSVSMRSPCGALGPPWAAPQALASVASDALAVPLPAPWAAASCPGL